MARIRSFKPELWSEGPFMAIRSHAARLMYLGMWNFADDQGVIPYAPKSIKARIFPGDEDIDQRQIVQMLDQLGGAGLLGLFENEGHRFLVIHGFREKGSLCHQVIDKPATRYPTPKNVAKFGDCSPTIPGLFADQSPADRTGQEGSPLLRNKGPDGPDAQKAQNQPQDAPTAPGAGEQRQEPVSAPATKPNETAALLLSKVVPPAGDWGKALFGPGLAFAAEHMGLSPTRTRPIIGRWLQTAGRSDGGQPHRAVFQTLARAQLEGVADLRSWMPAALGGKREGGGEAPATVVSMIRRGDKSAYEKAIDLWQENNFQGPRPRLEDFQGEVA